VLQIIKKRFFFVEEIYERVGGVIVGLIHFFIACFGSTEKITYIFCFIRRRYCNNLLFVGFKYRSFYGVVKKLIFLKKLILILKFDSFLNC